jgi:BolA protein
MNRSQRITTILQENLKPTHLDVRDDSHKHAGHAGAQPGGETHYAVAVQAECFRGLSKVQRHQMIYKLLAEELANGLHALAIEAQVPEGQ